MALDVNASIDPHAKLVIRDIGPRLPFRAGAPVTAPGKAPEPVAS